MAAIDVNSNINIEYERIVASLADRAKLIHDDQPDLTRAEAINRAMEEGFFEYAPRAYVLAYAFYEGFIKWNHEITSDDWNAIWCMLEDDVRENLDEVVDDEDWE